MHARRRRCQGLLAPPGRSPILMEVTRWPHALSSTPMLLAVTPLPSPLTTPPAGVAVHLSRVGGGWQAAAPLPSQPPLSRPPARAACRPRRPHSPVTSTYFMLPACCRGRPGLPLEGLAAAVCLNGARALPGAGLAGCRQRGVQPLSGYWRRWAHRRHKMAAAAASRHAARSAGLTVVGGGRLLLLPMGPPLHCLAAPLHSDARVQQAGTHGHLMLACTPPQGSVQGRRTTRLAGWLPLAACSLHAHLAPFFFHIHLALSSLGCAQRGEGGAAAGRMWGAACTAGWITGRLPMGSACCLPRPSPLPPLTCTGMVEL